MPKYKVELERTVYQTGDVFIEADDPDKAAELAKQEADNDDVDWLDDPDEVEVTNVAEAENGDDPNGDPEDEDEEEEDSEEEEDEEESE